MGLLDWLFKKKEEEEIKEEVERKYKIPNITLLVLSDLHRSLTEEQRDIIEKNREQVDAVITLGDIPVECLKEIDMDFGVLGNHDYFGQLGDKDIHGKKIEVKGVSFTGIQGCHRYKDGPFVMYSQEESLGLDIPKADILITHDMMFNENIGRVSHCGLKGIARYIEGERPFLHIHGHQHKNIERKYCDTLILGIYKCSLIKIRDSEVYVEDLF